MVFLFYILQYDIYYYMNIYEVYDDNNLTHIENGPDYGQTYYGSQLNTLAWSIEDSFEFEYYNSCSSNKIIIEPIYLIDSN